MDVDEPIEAEHAATLIKLRNRLAAIGYLDPAELFPRLGLTPSLMPPPYLRFYVQGDDEPLDIAAKLFLAGVTMPRADVRRLLDEGLIDEMVSLGHFSESDGQLQPDFVLIPWFGLLLMGDPARRVAEWEVVTPPENASAGILPIAMARFRPGARMLDVGTGTGVFALLAARAGCKATGIDINPRSIYYSRLNAAMNELDAEFRVHDLCDGFPEGPWDLLLTNLPGVYDVSGLSGIVFTSGATDLLPRTYAGLDAVMADGGNIILRHEMIPGDEERLLKHLKDWSIDFIWYRGAPLSRVLSVRVVGQKDGKARYRRMENLGFELVWDDYEAVFTSFELAERGVWDELTARLNPGAALVGRADAGGEVSYVLGGLPLKQKTVDLIAQIQGRRRVSEIATTDEAIATLKALAESGRIILEPLS